MWMPQCTAADGIMCLELAVQLLCLPVPYKQLPVRVARNEVAATAKFGYLFTAQSMPVFAVAKNILSHTKICINTMKKN